jgi:hypothetical protein
VRPEARAFHPRGVARAGSDPSAPGRHRRSTE